MESQWKLTILFGLCVSLEFISATTAATSLDVDLSNINMEMKLLAAIGVGNPNDGPTRSKADFVIPDDIRSKYNDLLRSHRTRRMISKGIHKNPDIDGDILYTESSRQGFSFDISSIPSSSDILMAELSIFKERPNESRMSGNHTHRHPINTARASIHQINSDPDSDGSASSMELIDERLVPIDNSGWQLFDVTSSVRNWLENPALNFGLQLTVNEYRPGRYAKRVADSVRASMIRHGRDDVPGTALDTPVLTIYTVKYAPREDPLDCEVGVEPTSCCRTSRYIDFRETKWTDRWIIEPAGFEAFDCIGACQNHRNNRHRSLRDIFSMPFQLPSGPSELQQCGISRSSALPMMYLIERNGVTELEVSEIPDMIIDECHCMQ